MDFFAPGPSSSPIHRRGNDTIYRTFHSTSVADLHGEKRRNRLRRRFALMCKVKSLLCTVTSHFLTPSPTHSSRVNVYIIYTYIIYNILYTRSIQHGRRCYFLNMYRWFTVYMPCITHIYYIYTTYIKLHERRRTNP